MNVFESQANEFRSRHIGPNEAEAKQMLKTIGVSSLEELIDSSREVRDELWHERYEDKSVSRKRR